MQTLLKRLLTDDSGQDIAEYAMSMAILGLGVAGVIYALNNNLRTVFVGLTAALH